MFFSLRKIATIIGLGIFLSSTGQEENLEKNMACLKCHENQTYSFYNEWTEFQEKRLMNPFYILNGQHFASSVHGSFKCTDCHSPDYEAYPHDAELKLEPLNTCLDCHGGDETYATYKFDQIGEEFEKSVHFSISGESFTCSKCHNQHYYMVTARKSTTVKEIVAYNNQMCLSCHEDGSKYQLLSEHASPQLSVVHDWLPNQELHFDHVRCIECHTEATDSFLVSHNVLPKGQAVKKCVQCHSSNTMLKASLYKYENIQAREDGGLSTIIANQSYIIGANQVPFLKTLSIIIFLCVVGGIAFHIVLRIIKS